MSLDDMKNYIKKANPEMKPHYQGIVQTIWSEAGSFLDRYYRMKESDADLIGSMGCAITVLNKFAELR